MNPETNDTTETETDDTIEISDDLSPLRISGARNTLFLVPSLENDSGRPSVHLFSCIGSGTPERAWHRRWYALASIPDDATPDGIRARLERDDVQAWLRKLDGLYLGTKWDGNNMVGQWSFRDAEEDFDVEHQVENLFADLPQYWRASDWYQVFTTAQALETIDETPDGKPLTLAELVDREVESAALNDAALEPGDVEETLRSFAERWLDEHDDESEDDERDTKVRAIALRWLGRPPAFTLTPKQRKQILLVEFGEIEGYFAEDEIDARREAWESSEASWRAAILELLNAKDRDEAKRALADASRVEDEWGDDPSTQRVAEIAGLDTKEG